MHRERQQRLKERRAIQERLRLNVAEIIEIEEGKQALLTQIAAELDDPTKAELTPNEIIGDRLSVYNPDSHAAKGAAARGEQAAILAEYLSINAAISATTINGLSATMPL